MDVETAKFAGAALTGLAALLGAFYAIWGPPWPTSPEIRVSGIDPSSPFAFPFQIANKSALFGVHIDRLNCSAQPSIKLGSAMLPWLSSAVLESHFIRARETRNYSCSTLLRMAGRPNESIELTVTATYHNVLYEGFADQCFQWINADQYSRWINGCQPHILLRDPFH